MTDMSNVRDTIKTEFNRVWNRRTPVMYDNERFTPSDRDESWLSFSIQPLNSEQFTIGAVGSRQYNNEGMLDVAVFVPLNDSTGAGTAMVQAVRDTFEGKRFDNITFGASRFELGGRYNDNWFVTSIVIEFNYYQVR